jgi:hypothetical protein
VSPLLTAGAGRIGGMAFSFLYLAVRALLGAAFVAAVVST